MACQPICLDGSQLARDKCEDGSQPVFTYFIPITDDSSVDDLTSKFNDKIIKYTWVDSQTRDVEVRFAVYNGNYKLFAVVQVLFDLKVGGNIKNKIKVSVLDLEQSAGDNATALSSGLT